MADDGERASEPGVGDGAERSIGAGQRLAAVDIEDFGEDVEAPAASPAVVAVVSTAGGPGLEGALADLAAQRYGALTVLVIDTNPESAVVERVAGVVPTALVLARPDHDVADAANEVIGTVEGAPFLLFLADDVRVEPDLVRHLVEEAYRSNAGVLGPKIVEEGRRAHLVDVGFSIDHYGVRYDPIDLGELDQEQHDAVRDVFGVSIRVLLVRADLFEALGGFDARCGPAVDVDFAWRAHLAGARVLVVPDAIACADAAPRADARDATYGRVRALAKSYSGLALVWTVPIALGLTVAESSARLAQRRPRHARALLLGWFDAVRDARSILAARRATQAQRRADDRDVRLFMIRGSARLRVFMTRRLHADERLATASLRTRTAIDEASDVLHRNESVFVLTLLAVVLIGARGLLSGPPTIRGLASWTDAHTLWQAFTSLHRRALIGSTAPGPAVFGLAALLSTLLLGHADLARALVITAAPLVGVYGAYRVGRALAAEAIEPGAGTRSAWPAVLTAVGYAANPVSRNAAANGDLGALLTFAVAPFVLLLMVGGARQRRVRPRRVVGVAMLTAVAASAAPVAVVLPLAISVAVVGAAVFAGRDGRAVATMREAALATVGAFVLLLPASALWLSGDAPVLGAQPRPQADLGAVLAFRTGPNGVGWLPYGLLAAAALALIVASGARFRHAAVGWVLFVVGVAAAYVPGRLDATIVRPSLDVVLTPAALGLAVAIGAGFGAFLAELRSFVFGARQIVATAAAVALVLPVLSFLGDVADGRFRAPGTTWESTLAFLPADAVDAGPSRVLWIGDVRALPADAVEARDVTYALTTGVAPDVRDLLPHTTAASALVAQAVAVARDHRTARLGHLLAPLGIRYVVLSTRAAADASPTPRDAALAGALDAQLDLAARDLEGLRVYTNEAWFPMEARLGTRVSIPTGRAAARDPIGAILTSDLDRAGPLSAVGSAGPILVAESHSGRRRATVGHAHQLPRAAFGVTDGFSGGAGVARISFVTPWWFSLAIAAQVALWLCALTGPLIARRRRRRHG